MYWKDNESEVVHYAHAFNGGVEINERAETTIPGLFAAGEVAAGPHGADRIGGCMMTATQVFGERAGRCAALRAKKIDAHPDPKGSLHVIKMIEEQSAYNPKDKELLKLKKRIKKIFSRNMMILRSKDGLNTCLQEIKETDSHLDKIEGVNRLDFLNFKNMLLTMQLIAASALNREESSGPHYRTDSTT